MFQSRDRRGVDLFQELIEQHGAAGTEFQEFHPETIGKILALLQGPRVDPGNPATGFEYLIGSSG